MNREQPGRKRVLLIEDDAWIRTFLRDALGDHGYAVDEAADGRTGMRLASESRPDVVLLDLAMPEVTGVDVLHELRRRPATRRLPVLVLSAYRRVLSDADARCVTAVLKKPVDVDDLLARVEEATSRSVTTARRGTIKCTPA
jgi:two-component system phosphate regulon response regulator PhoB